MSRYEVYKDLHIIGVIVWFGGGFMLQVLLGRARKAGPESVRSFNEAAEWTSQRIFMPASFAVLILGILMVVDGPWRFSDQWIGIGILGFAITAINGMANLGPTARKMKALIAEKGPADGGVERLSKRMSFSGRIDLIVLAAVVLDMVVKPGA